MNPQPIRVVQWTTGKVAREAIKAILDRPELELVGLYAFSADKVGRDVGELIELGHTVGVKATDQIDELIALKPDVVTYMPLHPNVEHMCQLLRAGINVATTASFMTGRGYGEDARKALQDAALAGGASMFGSGINPGWIDSVVATASSACREVNLVQVTESFNIGMWAGDANQDELGWGRPAGDPGHAADIEKATLPFGDAVEAVAHMFDFTLDDVRCEVSFAHATEDLDIPGRPVKRGHVAGIHAKWLGIAEGLPVVELNAQWVISEDIEPQWDIQMAYDVVIHGTPQIKLRADVLPADMSLPMEELVATGFVITAMPVVNALPAVVAAQPGIITYADIKPVTSVLRPKPVTIAEAPVDNDDDEPQNMQDSGSNTSVEGTWKVAIKAPTGAMETTLVIDNNNGEYSGEQFDNKTTAPIEDVRVDGNEVSWINIATKPVKLKCQFKGTIQGRQMTGKVKAGFMGSYKFTATKI